MMRRSTRWCATFRLRGRRVAISGAVRVSSGNWSAPLSGNGLCVVARLFEGQRGGRLFETNWTRVLDSSPSELRTIAAESKRLNGLDLRAAGDVIEIGFTTVLTSQEIKDSRVAH